MIGKTALLNGVPIYSDPYVSDIFISVFDLKRMSQEEITLWINSVIQMQREVQLRDIFGMLGRKFDYQFFRDGDFDIILNGVLFSDEEKQQLVAFMKYGNSIYGKKEKTPKREIDKSGYVYLIRMGQTGYYKIGHSNNPDRRINEDISPRLPEKPMTIHLIETQDRFALESKLHKLYKSKRKNGEWFELSQDDIDYIRSL